MKNFFERKTTKRIVDQLNRYAAQTSEKISKKNIRRTSDLVKELAKFSLPIPESCNSTIQETVFVVVDSAQLLNEKQFGQERLFPILFQINHLVLNQKRNLLVARKNSQFSQTTNQSIKLHFCPIFISHLPWQHFQSQAFAIQPKIVFFAPYSPCKNEKERYSNQRFNFSSIKFSGNISSFNGTALVSLSKRF
jgi:hypothetical protein